MKPNVGRIATLYVLFIAFNQKRILFNKSKGSDTLTEEQKNCECFDSEKFAAFEKTV